MRLRLISILVIIVLSLSVGAVAFAEGANPNNPVAHPTATATGASAQPTPTDDNFFDDQGSDSGTPVDTGSDNAASPQASPTTNEGISADLAAMTLDADQLPAGWTLSSEQYISIDQLVAGTAGAISKEQMEATGMTGYYESSYVNSDGTADVRTYIIAYQTVEGEQKGFDLLEDEDLLVPNGSLQDQPGLEGVGEKPSEITSGTIENGDGTESATYDISFRIGTMEVGAASETFDGSEPDSDTVQQMAHDLADRANAVLANQPVANVDYALPAQSLMLDGTIAYEGYEAASEMLPGVDATSISDSYLGSYSRAFTYGDGVTTPLPLVVVSLASFDSANAIDEILLDSSQLGGQYANLAQIANFDAGSADNVVAFSYSSPLQGGNSSAADSVRAYVQVGSTLVVIDVQGEKDAEAAQTIAEGLVAKQIECLQGGSCSAVLDTSTL